MSHLAFFGHQLRTPDGVFLGLDLKLQGIRGMSNQTAILRFHMVLLTNLQWVKLLPETRTAGYVRWLPVASHTTGGTILIIVPPEVGSHVLK
jgi:hypothetical protein